MEIKTFKAEYGLVEFCHYIDCTNATNQISVIELLVDTSDIEFLKDELTNIFAIETQQHTYVFSGYEISECYETDCGLIKVVCVK